MSNDYEKPESQGVGGDELEGVSGGAGETPEGVCDMGHVPTACQNGSYFAEGDCHGGGEPSSGKCVSGKAR